MTPVTATLAPALPPVRPLGPIPGTSGRRGPDFQPCCPTCRHPVGSLLAGCNRAACRIADLDYDRAFERRFDS